MTKATSATMLQWVDEHTLSYLNEHVQPSHPTPTRGEKDTFKAAQRRIMESVIRYFNANGGSLYDDETGKRIFNRLIDIAWNKLYTPGKDDLFKISRDATDTTRPSTREYTGKIADAVAFAADQVASSINDAAFTLSADPQLSTHVPAAASRSPSPKATEKNMQEWGQRNMLNHVNLLPNTQDRKEIPIFINAHKRIVNDIIAYLKVRKPGLNATDEEIFNSLVNTVWNNLKQSKDPNTKDLPFEIARSVIADPKDPKITQAVNDALRQGAISLGTARLALKPPSTPARSHSVGPTQSSQYRQTYVPVHSSSQLPSSQFRQVPASPRPSSQTSSGSSQHHSIYIEGAPPHPLGPGTELLSRFSSAPHSLSHQTIHGGVTALSNSSQTPPPSSILFQQSGRLNNLLHNPIHLVVGSQQPTHPIYQQNRPKFTPQPSSISNRTAQVIMSAAANQRGQQPLTYHLPNKDLLSGPITAALHISDQTQSSPGQTSALLALPGRVQASQPAEAQQEPEQHVANSPKQSSHPTPTSSPSKSLKPKSVSPPPKSLGNTPSKTDQVFSTIRTNQERKQKGLPPLPPPPSLLLSTKSNSLPTLSPQKLPLMDRVRGWIKRGYS